MEDKIKSEYDQLLKTGIFYEFFPELSGSWDKDKTKFIRFYKLREKLNNGK